MKNYVSHTLLRLVGAHILYKRAFTRIMKNVQMACKQSIVFSHTSRFKALPEHT